MEKYDTVGNKSVYYYKLKHSVHTVCMKKRLNSINKNHQMLLGGVFSLNGSCQKNRNINIMVYGQNCTLEYYIMVTTTDNHFIITYARDG